MNNQSLDLMGLFAVLVEQGSFTAAAEALEMPKSSVSQKLARLEAHLGIRLLQRTTRRLNLTPQGEIYYQHCRAIRELAGQAEREMTQLQHTPAGRLRITAPEATGTLLLGALLASFQRAHPRVYFDLVLSDDQVDLVGEGFDLAMRAAPLKDSSLICRRVGSVPRHLVASPDYLRQQGVPETLAELGSHNCLVHHALPRWPLGERPFQPLTRMHSNSLLALHQMALGGAGIALLPQHVCEYSLQQGALQRVLPDLEIPDNPFYFVYPSREYLAPSLVALMSWLQERLPFARR